MQLYPLKLVTVVGESVIMDDIAEEGMKLGATGFTMTEVNGHGSRSARNVASTTGARTTKGEFVVPADAAGARSGVRMSSERDLKNSPTTPPR